MRDQRKMTGRIGEDLALQHLLNQGYQLVTRNYRCPLGEIDLIVASQEMVIFVEVRTRRGYRLGTPEESIRQNKRDRVRRVAQYYLQAKKKRDIPVRFDVIAVIIGQANQLIRLNHIEAAF
ncbi:MAG: YraN family protein [Syntrophomonadaceae bacterium]|nr:YraN family protein [Syntrophomonadaceae bacterium]